MELVRWDPFRSLRRREDAFEDAFRDLLRRFGPVLPRFEIEGEVLAPSAEVAESDSEVTVKMEIPGVEKEQLQISVTDDELTVRGEVRKETEEKKKSYHRQEICYGAFQRTLTLPTEVDAAKAAAELKNGVLKITLPKATQQKARRIEIATR
jgi:HSP20 family protein